MTNLMPVKCDNCGWMGSEEEIKPLSQVHHLSERIAPGEFVPSGECLKCGAFCHEVKLETIAEAARILASTPKRANELTRDELVSIVNQLQVYLYTETSINGQKIKENGVEVWNAETENNGGDLVESLDYLLSHHGLRPGEEFTGQRVVHP